MSDEQKSSQRDDLTLTTEESKIELSEQELSRVTGGVITVRKAGEHPLEY